MLKNKSMPILYIYMGIYILHKGTCDNFNSTEIEFLDCIDLKIANVNKISDTLQFG